MEQVKLINGGLSVDDRGTLRFVNDFNFEGVKRFYQVQNHSKGFIRAWHGHKKEAKYVYVVKGSILIGAVELDLNDNKEIPDKDYVVQSFTLSSEKPSILYIPPDYANGFMTLTDDTIVQFFSTSTLEESLTDDYRFPCNRWNIWKIEPR